MKIRSLILLGILGFGNPFPSAQAAEQPTGREREIFSIQVLDAETGLGVPLVELKTVNHVSWWTDSAGRVAFQEPGLIGQKVYFQINSPGYEYPADGFGRRGKAFEVIAGGAAEVKIKRLQPAERLYRITGQGIYRDTILVGKRPPTRQPLINAQVVGQDTVIATPYRGKVYWFWGDTDRASYPLGNFGASGAVSEFPNRGGLPPESGIDLSYFLDASGFSKPMCPESEFDSGLRWIESVFTLPDEQGRERLYARVADGASVTNSRAWHLARFNDSKEVFESVARWPVQDVHDSSHPFRAKVGAIEYLYFYPNYRVPLNRNAVADLNQYQAYTCLAGSGKIPVAEAMVDRDQNGRLLFSWKTGADRLRPKIWNRLIREGKVKAEESWLQLRDPETGEKVEGGRGSVCWNDFRGRWVMICSGLPGKVWFSEADTPTGPWVYARKVAEHGRYNFYNPTQHSFFDQNQGQIIFFEGTYTTAFSSAPAKTPRYEYNQIIYRLRLDDSRLVMPVPVYRLKNRDGQTRHFLRDGVEKNDRWHEVESVPFFAMSPNRRQKGQIPIYPGPDGETWRLAVKEEKVAPLFYIDPPSSGSEAGLTQESLRDPSGKVLGRVWKNPSTVLTLDPGVRPR